MQPRVTAIVVSPDGPERLERTLSALEEGSRRPDRIVQVHAWDAFDNLPPAEPGEWLWLLSAETIPLPDALARLLAAVEVAPSVAVAGPKLVAEDDPSRILSFGMSLTSLGKTVRLVENELDQAQHDRSPDVLGVAREGVLVRREVFEALGGLDAGLPVVDAGLDLSVRARLAGHRVIRVDDARVVRVRRPEDVGRAKPAPRRVRDRIARRAQLHRRLVWAPAIAVPFHWLSLLPLAILRSIWRLLTKRPESIGGEFAAAILAAFDTSVPRARRNLARSRRAGWAAIAPLRVPGDEMRRRRVAERERRAEERGIELEIRRARFVPGGFTILLVAAAASAILNWRLLGATEVGGGALRLISSSPAELWRNAWGHAGEGILSWIPADPFAAVLATLGSVFFWDTSLALVLLWLGALPLSALGAWWCATRLSVRAWPPVVAAIAWMLAPPLLIALADGRPGAVVAHLLLPWLVLAAIDAQRSWSASAGAALLAAATMAAAPSLAPAIVVAAVVAGALRPRAVVRLVGIPVLGLAVLAPVAVLQFLRGTPLRTVADPGLPVAIDPAAGWELLLGIPRHGANSWEALLGDGLPAWAPVVIAAAPLVPLAILALLAVFLPGARKAIPALLVALLGLGTAVASAHLIVGGVGAAPLTPWPGAGLSLMWLGLIGAAVSAIETLRPASVPLGALLVVGSIAAVVPIGFATATDRVAVGPDAGVLPAIVEAQAADDPELGTLVLTAEADGSITATIERGAGRALDSLTTLETTDPKRNEALAELAGNLVSFGAADAVPAFEEFRIGYVLVSPADRAARPTERRMVEALDASPQLQPVGQTATGTLWRTDADLPVAEDAAPRSAAARTILGVQGALLVIALLLALPTSPRRRVVDEHSLPGEDPADTFDEDDNA